MIIHLVCAARPNFMKVAPLYHALAREDWADPILVHTGQHYDPNMSDAFFKDLSLPNPDIYLDVKSGTHAEQTGKVMIAYEKILNKQRPDLIVVIGDVNATMAATIAASKLGIKVAHLEAGLRSFDRRMPEEINRLVTDVLADILWTPSQDGSDNLAREGVAPDKIHLVGNIMIDSLEMLREEIEANPIYKKFGVEPQDYGVVTLHRPSNVDNPAILQKICDILQEVAKNLLLPDPLNYIRFMNLVFNCRFVITDSGGIQEETSYLGIPCLTLRENTERPITITQGTNQLCKLNDVQTEINKILQYPLKNAQKIAFWDGKTAERIVENLKNLLMES